MRRRICEHLLVSSPPGRHGLRSTDSLQLVVPRTRLSKIGDRAFTAAGVLLWYSLPAYVTSSPSLSIFDARLKSHLFSIPLPGAVVHCC